MIFQRPKERTFQFGTEKIYINNRRVHILESRNRFTSLNQYAFLSLLQTIIAILHAYKEERN